MRFSLKWILAAMVYVAIAAPAFGTGKWYFADALWALTLLAVGYALLVAAFASGRRRVMASGFAVVSISFVLCATFGGDALPTPRIVDALLPGNVATSQTVTVPVAAPPPVSVNAPITVSMQAVQAWRTTTIRSPLIYPNNAGAPIVDINVYLRAANAVATLAFGLIGSLVGLMAFRASAEAKGRETN